MKCGSSVVTEDQLSKRTLIFADGIDLFLRRDEAETWRLIFVFLFLYSLDFIQPAELQEEVDLLQPLVHRKTVAG